MKCPNCNQEIENGSEFCMFCGKSVPTETTVEPAAQTEEPVKVVEEVKEEDTPIVETPNVEENEPIVEEPVKQPVVEEPKAAPQATVAPKAKTDKKRHSIITLAILGAVMLLAIIVVVVVMLLSGSPESMYKKMIEEATMSSMANDAVSAKKGNISANLELSTDIEDLEDVVDGLKANVNLQYDLDVKNILAQATASLDDEVYLDEGKMLINLADEKIYFGEKSIYDELLYLEIPEDVMDEIEDILKEDVTIEKNVAKAAAKSVANAINSNLLPEYFFKNKVTVNINGKNKNVTDNALVLTLEQFAEVYENTLTTLKEDKDFLAYFKDKDDDIKDAIDLLLDEVEYMEDEEGTIEVHYYTSGMFKTFVGAAFVATDDWGDQAIIEVVNTEKNTYDIAFKEVYDGDEEELFTAKVVANKLTKNEADLEVSFEVKDEGEFTAKVALATVYNKDMDSLDVSNAANVEELTEDEATEISDNLEDSNLYSILSSFMESEDDYDDDYDYDEQDLPEGVTLQEGEACVLTYDDDVVKFQVPSTFEEDYGGNSYKAYSKNVNYDYAEVDIDAEWATMDEYTQEIDESLDYLEGLDGYKDISISEASEVEVNGIKYKTKTTSYTSVVGSSSFVYKTTYYYTKINDEYTYVVAVSDDEGLMTTDELNKFLTITLE